MVPGTFSDKPELNTKPAAGEISVPPSPDSLPAAARDYRLLLDRGYPVAATLKLVGDRHRLDKKERNILFRGVLNQVTSATIAARLVSAPDPGFSLALDGYNVLFTLINYRRGHPLFLSTDGLVRDAGGAYGRISHSADFGEALELLVPMLASLVPSLTTVYLDAPVSGSGGHASAIREVLAKAGLPCQVQVVPSADPPLIAFDGQLVATSDSVIAARAQARVYDLARATLEYRYGVEFMDLRSWL
ncbi:MAG: DUF434 domain-containing protein [Spirochaetota bacterium]